MKCPKCGYENKTDVLCCGLCYEVLKKAKTESRPAPPEAVAAKTPDTKSHKPMTIPKSFLAKPQDLADKNNASPAAETATPGAESEPAPKQGISKIRRGPASINTGAKQAETSPPPKPDNPTQEESVLFDDEPTSPPPTAPVLGEQANDPISASQRGTRRFKGGLIPTPQTGESSFPAMPPMPEAPPFPAAGNEIQEATKPAAAAKSTNSITPGTRQLKANRAALAMPHKEAAKPVPRESPAKLGFADENGNAAQTNTSVTDTDPYAPPCKSHFGRPSAGKCKQCGNNFCAECLQKKDQVQYCRNCYKKLNTMDMKTYQQKCIELLTDPKKFFREMPQEGSYFDIIKFMVQSYHLVWASVIVVILLVALLGGGMVLFAAMLGAVISLPYLILTYLLCLLFIVLGTFLSGGLLFLLAMALGSNKGYKPNFMIAGNVYAVQTAMAAAFVVVAGLFLVLFKSLTLVQMLAWLWYASYVYIGIGILCFGMMKIHNFTVQKAVIIGVALVLVSLGIEWGRDYIVQKRIEKATGLNIKNASHTPTSHTQNVSSNQEGTLELDDDNFDREVLESKKPVLVDFWAAWCGPCRVMSPAVEQIAGEYRGRAKVCKFDVDKCREIPERYGITSIPTIIIFKNKQIVKQWTGSQREVDENKTMLRQALNEVLNE